MQRKIAVLTSGGDSPGMNAAVMEVARSAAKNNLSLVGIKHGFNGLIDGVIADDRLDFDLGEKIHHVFRAAVEFGMTFLAPEAFDFGNGDALDAHPGKRVFYFFQFEGFNYGFYFFQHNLLFFCHYRDCCKWKRFP